MNFYLIGFVNSIHLIVSFTNVDLSMRDENLFYWNNPF